MSDHQLFGRAEEFTALDALVDGLAEAGGALVVRGAPGIGKSALLARAARQAERSGFTVLTASGVEAESHLPFAGLHQLTRTMLDQVPGLPPVQAEALLGAFGMAQPSPTGRAPQLFMIALATLDLLGEAAGQAPVLLVVDDAHWLDSPTLDVLAFIARRLGPEPLGMLFGIRDGHTTCLDTLALRELRLHPSPRPMPGPSWMTWSRSWNRRSGTGCSTRPRATPWPSSNCLPRCVSREHRPRP
ncbi:AAA family ATPase [Streptomyces aureus]|uniref:AAA family ATPase n=1 Tax=Streptomyces aureus TaxID=193461 RepID=UPI003644FE36